MWAGGGSFKGHFVMAFHGLNGLKFGESCFNRLAGLNHFLLGSLTYVILTYIKHYETINFYRSNNKEDTVTSKISSYIFLVCKPSWGYTCKQLIFTHEASYANISGLTDKPVCVSQNHSC